MALLIAYPTAELAGRYLNGAYAFNIFGIVLAGLLMELSTRCEKSKVTVTMAVFTLMLSHVPPALFADTHMHAILCTLFGAVVITIAYKHGLRSMIGLGILMLLCGIGRPVAEFAQWLDFSNWITLSVSGGAIIVIASLIERHGAFIKMKWDRLSDIAE